MKKEDGVKPLPVLAVCVLLAVALWFFWLCVGMSWTHSKMADKISPVSTSVSQPLNVESTTDAEAGAKARERFFSEVGQTGDAFGGLNALLTAIGGALVGWAGFMQYQTLATAKVEAEEERKHRKRQEFESLFFQLLELSTRITDKIERSSTTTSPETHEKVTTKHVGARALDSYAHRIAREVNPAPGGDSDVLNINKDVLRELVHSYFRYAYGKKPSSFGPYFRILFQIFKHISESDLPLKEQIRFSNIARGQISDGAVLLLALNGVTPHGHKFAPLVEKFGLLEHLHATHRRRYEPALRLAYRPRAFMGSAERAKAENAWIPDPLLPEDHFSVLQMTSAEKDENS